MKALLEKRSRILQAGSLGTGPVLYLMDRDMRISNNHALLSAQQRAHEKNVPLIVLYCLIPGFLGGSYRQHVFKVQGLKQLSHDFKKLHIPFFVMATEDPASTIASFASEHAVSEIVTDFSPLRIQRNIKEALIRETSLPLVEVDTHNLIPAWIVSTKAEVGARTLRPKLYKLIKEFPHTEVRISKQRILYPSPAIDFERLQNDGRISREVSLSEYVGGEDEARRHLKHFIARVLPEYAQHRNNPLREGQSGLSPYLHYGMLSVFQIVRAVEHAVGAELPELMDARKNLSGAPPRHVPTPKESAGAFLEELIVRKELADNFCLYHPDSYDSVKSFPEWARKTLTEHESDAREYLYTKAEFENAKTHDELWNAAQLEMVRTGKMHGYMRMYWAKKILEWTKDVETAQNIAIYLNDKYELDGRDPNGYAGIAWSMGGVHDRPWFTRPIFGLVRYMARSGCESKFNVKAYIERFQSEKLPL